MIGHIDLWRLRLCLHTNATTTRPIVVLASIGGGWFADRRFVPGCRGR